jgi:hypothetical protein
MATKLSIYNDALRAIGDLRLANITEDVEARYVLDDAWPDTVAIMFTEGLWNFATKTQEITADPGQPPIPGFAYTFDKPLNWVRTITISGTSLFSTEAIYRDEDNRIYAHNDTLYIRFVSNDKAEDDQIVNWPPTFAKAVAAYLAKQCAERISGSSEKAADLKTDYITALASAKNKDALDQSKVILRPGNWVRAMRGASSHRDSGPLSGY